jgi:hypothetical protein
MVTIETTSAEGTELRRATRVSRRGMFRVGTAFVATLVALSTPKSVLAFGCGTPCCNLRVCNLCPPNGGCSGGGWICPQGYQPSWWICQGGGKTCTCGECTVDPNNCNDSHWSTCSYWSCN